MKNKIVGKWIELENIILNEVNPSQEGKECILCLICASSLQLIELIAHFMWVMKLEGAREKTE